MNTNFIFPILALFISILSIILSIITSRRQKQTTSLNNNHSGIITVESQIGETISLLRFHGIDNPELELDKHGVTKEEFVYLLASFTLGGTYYMTAQNPESSFKKGGYRDRMCQSSGTRRVWPLLRRMFEQNEYRDMLDTVFEKLDKNSPLNMRNKESS